MTPTLNKLPAPPPVGSAAAPTGAEAEVAKAGCIRNVLATLSDRRLAAVLSVTLFALAAWPLLLVEIPPLQDLPNHLATVTVLQHPDRYPEFTFNGFWKTNSALFVWLLFVGKVVGTHAAAKAFVAVVLAANAWIIPRLVWSVAGRDVAVTASLCAFPMIHHWYVSAGMLDFALGFAMATGVLLLLAHGRPIAAAFLAAMTWYAHAFPLVVIDGIVAIAVLSESSWSARFDAFRRLALPLLPASFLVVVSVLRQVGDGNSAMNGFVVHHSALPTWELVYNLWAEWLYAFTSLSVTSIVPGLLLAYFAFRNRTRSIALFLRATLVALIVAYAVTPYMGTNWFYLNSRIVPFLCLAAMVRLPAQWPRSLDGILMASAILYSAGLGVDYLRLDADRLVLTAGMEAVPEGATLLPLFFRHKRTSENTKSILHAWGFYVEKKLTSAPLLFAHSKSFPLTYTAAPPIRFNHLVLENFAPNMGDPTWMCKTLREGGVVVEDCGGEWRKLWAEFWGAALPRYDHVLLWQAPPDVQATLPPEYRVTFERAGLQVLERSGR